ncbi:MAG: ABC transporter [Firmicutes bacterium HGW-Firmicutes-15]|nr:MAG: ABC transporter [Firmicutes bacterium HGW-Firmicutes-15]
MHMTSWAGLRRFLTVLNLFISIFWAFYSLKYKKWWHKKSWVESKRQELYASQARRFRTTAVNLGGLLIKLGQFFSTRVDVLPQITVRELAGLQDEVQPVSFNEIRQVAENEFSRPLDEIYSEVEEMPIASASLGQVHRGVLTEGQTVAIKILRPGIEDLVRIDLRAVRKIIDLLKIFTDWERMVDFDAIYQEFSDTLQEELDYIQEGHNAETIAHNTQEDADILIPTIYWDYTNRRVLTMEFMEGIKISDYERLENAGVDRKAVASKLLQTYVRQVLVDGFFHADPHPGNLFVTEDGRLIMIDFGMVGTIPPALRDVLVELVIALVKRDYVQVVAYLKRIGFLRYDADNELVARAVGVLLEAALGSSQDLYSADFSGLLTDLEQLLYEQPFQIPAQFTFLGRALGTLYGLCIGLDPNINFLDESKPYLKDLAKGEAGLWNQIKEKATLMGSSLVEIPPLLERVLSRADRGELNLKIPLSSINDAIAANTKAVRLVAWALGFGFTLLTAAYLLVNQLHNEARYAFYGAGFIFLFMLRQNWSSGRKRIKAPHPHMVTRRGRDS